MVTSKTSLKACPKKQSRNAVNLSQRTHMLIFNFFKETTIHILHTNVVSGMLKDASNIS